MSEELSNILLNDCIVYLRRVLDSFSMESILKLWPCHTCDKLQKGIREIFLSFQGGFSKIYRIYRKILNSDEGDFEILVKSGMF